MKRSPTKVAAVVSINEPAQMSGKGRKMVAEWLRQTADDFEKRGGEYGGQRFRGRFYCKSS